MAKFWLAGFANTRLAAEIGDCAAAELHRTFVRTLTGELADCGQRRIAAVTPDSACSAFAREIGPNWSVIPQGDGDLGRRMQRAFHGSAGAEAGRSAAVVMIGADTPTLTREEIEAAFDRLAACDAVFGPALDGGYYLIGLRYAAAACSDPAGFPRLFEDIAWSTPAVLQQTLDRCRQLGLSFSLLDRREDVDDAAALARLIAELGPDRNERLHESSVRPRLAKEIAEVLGRHRAALSGLSHKAAEAFSIAAVPGTGANR